MFSWLNFEELLIHNPIELINPSKDTISVAMNKKQYIEFFSNKYTYNGLYYDEEMDFCLFYYADPLQSIKDGDVYAQGYIDVEMKIYRVKLLCNVSISRFNYNFNLGDNTKTFIGADGGNDLKGSIKIDPATKKTPDGDFNYLTFKPTRNDYDWFRFYLIPNSSTPNMTKVTVKPNTKYTFSVYLKGTGQHTIYAYKGWTAPNTPWEFQVNLTNDWKLYTFTVTSKNIIPNTDVQFFIRSNTGTEINLKKPKVEEGSFATFYMPSKSEATSVDFPKWNVTKTEMLVSTKSKAITTVLNGALAKCTKDKNITGWLNQPTNANYNYRQPQYSLDIESGDFIISGFGLRGLKNG